MAKKKDLKGPRKHPSNADSMTRAQLSPLHVSNAINSVEILTKARLQQKGRHILVSRHEIQGVLLEEAQELIEKVRHGTLEEVTAELMDVTVAGIVGLASINTGKVQW